MPPSINEMPTRPPRTAPAMAPMEIPELESELGVEEDEFEGEAVAEVEVEEKEICVVVYISVPLRKLMTLLGFCLHSSTTVLRTRIKLAVGLGSIICVGLLLPRIISSCWSCRQVRHDSASDV